MPVKELEEFMAQITSCIDSRLKETLSQLAKHHPQAPPMTGSARMKEVIPNIDILQDKRSDLICINDIKIEEYK